jgi:hypothetical protein
LINSDKTASPLFNRFFDAIFNLGDATIAPQNTGAIEPAKAAVLFEAMAYAASNNTAKSFLQFATENRFPNPQATQNEATTMAWRVFGIPHTTTPSGISGLTREGFRAVVLRDTLMDPVVQLRRLNFFLTQNYARLIDPETRSTFPNAPIPPSALPTAGDPEVQRAYQQREAIMSAEFLQYQKTLMAVQINTHNATMDGLTPGYAVPNGLGGYNYHYTGGMNW